MIDLNKFCDPDDEATEISVPFTADGYTWATNRHIMIRVAEDYNYSDLRIGKRGKASQVFNEGYKISAKYAPLEPLPPSLGIHKITCRDCAGRGKEHYCPSCNCKCLSCGGSGEQDYIGGDDCTSVSIGEAFFDIKYIRLLQDLPNLKVQTTPPEHDPMSFRFDGGEGLLMPLIGKRRNNINLKIVGEATS